MNSEKEISNLASQIRRDVLRMIHAVQSGHPGAPLGCAEFFAALYLRILKHDPASFKMDGMGEDVFFLSNGHLSAGWYSVLARSGYFDIAELGSFRKLNSRLQGHPATADGLPGVRVASGSLGQGLSVAIGYSLSKKLNKDPYHVYVLMGDGEIQEGQVWEAAIFATAKKVDNLIAVIDYNKKQIDGPLHEVMPLGDLKNKWESFGWQVLETDGNDVKELLAAMEQAKALTGKGKPVMVLMHTIMGKGVDFMEDRHQWHGSPPNDAQLQSALSQLVETIGDY
ncbi:MAG: transketolase [Bacteroidales bacterium]|jgi:transketolase|nr:transketolase [Bacteroidales bacterium]